MIQPGMDRPETPEAAREWERACLSELRRIVERTKEDDLAPRISAVELKGAYPETSICASFWSRSRNEEREECYPLWDSSLTTPRGLETPDQVALLIHTWIREAA